jgi:hypothetical protein
LEDISQEEPKIITPLVSMGASFVNVANITKYKKMEIQKKWNPMELGLNREPEFLMNSMLTTNKELRRNLELNYKEWNSLTEPSWNSRFVMTPKTSTLKICF